MDAPDLAMLPWERLWCRVLLGGLEAQVVEDGADLGPGVRDVVVELVGVRRQLYG